VSAARNTVGALTNAWHGDNAPATFYAAAARVGYDPAAIMANLHAEATNYSYANLAVHHYGGGVENVNVTTSGLDEMLLQSYQNDVKVFPDWPANTNGKFGDLLAYGNFLISSSKAADAVQYVRAVSQSGGDFTFTNPWPGRVEVYRNGHHAGTVSGRRITLATSRHDTLELAPAGTALSTIRRELSRPLQVGTSSSFGSGFEPADPPLSWTDTVDTLGGGLAGVTGICCGVTGPQAGIRTGETAHTGAGALMYSGYAQGGSAVHAHLMVYDLSGSPLAAKTLSYWIYPQSGATTPWVPAGSDNSTCAGIELIFTDGSALDPADRCGHLALDTWNHVTVDLAATGAGKRISRILVGYDRPNSTGGYRGYLDDLTID
jgi:alpha-L-fucosidase 2